MKKILVAGIGNPLMSDEGVGGFLIGKLKEYQEDFPDVEFTDAGSGGMNLLHKINSRRKVILIDCAKMGTPPGTIKRFTPEQAESIKKLTHYSLHEADILKVLDISEKLGEKPQEVIIFGIEPANIAQGQKLSPCLTEKSGEYTSLILGELRE